MISIKPSVFVIVLDVINEAWRDGIPWEFLFADDLALIAESEAGLQEKYRKWKEGMLEKGLKINSKETKVLVSSKEKTRASIKGNRHG